MEYEVFEEDAELEALYDDMDDAGWMMMWNSITEDYHV